MEESDAKEIISILSEQFQVRAPKVKIVKQCRHGIYYRGSNRIVLPYYVRLHRTLEDTLLHEFAHSVAFQQWNKNPVPTFRPHGKEFQSILRAVIEAYYGKGNLDMYGWSSEYQQVAANYQRFKNQSTIMVRTKFPNK